MRPHRTARGRTWGRPSRGLVLLQRLVELLIAIVKVGQVHARGHIVGNDLENGLPRLGGFGLLAGLGIRGGKVDKRRGVSGALFDSLLHGVDALAVTRLVQRPALVGHSLQIVRLDA